MNRSLFGICAAELLALTLALGCGEGKQNATIAISNPSDLASSYDDNYQAAKSWQPIWVIPSSDLHDEFHPLLEKGFIVRIDAKPGSREETLFNSIIELTEPTEVVLLSIVGDKFVALAAGVTDRKSLEVSGSPITVPLFGGLYFNTGYLNQPHDTAPSTRKLPCVTGSRDNTTMHRRQ